MWPFTQSKKESVAPALFFTNTLSGKKELFVPLKPGTVSLYSCGPTVYSRAHIGNLRQYVFADVLARTLTESGYKVRRVINITDVGHLTGDNAGDADTGEDRIEKGAREAGMRAEDIAKRHTAEFMEDVRALCIDTQSILFPEATQYIAEQIAMIQTLEKEGHTYRTPDGIYFDTSTFPRYGTLGRRTELPTAESLHARIAASAVKRNPEDFALWKFSPLGLRRQQEWPSPWGRGFPGWHIECSAMSKALLGTEIDIHTGGIDHIPVHHNNEIAQSESVSGKSLARYWMHGAFLTIDEARIGKSMGNAIVLPELITRGIHPLALRYLFLQAHYRASLSFSWENITAAQEALRKLWKHAETARSAAKGVVGTTHVVETFEHFMRDDLGTPKALAFLWETLKHEELSAKALWGLFTVADAYLGLSLTNPPRAAPQAYLPADVQQLADERTVARTAHDFARADELRIHIETRGYTVDDTPSGTTIRKI